jgi:CheY-like chemotaxis protein
MSAPSILVVEDEALVALDLECTLQDMGWRIAASLGGVTETLDWLRRTDTAPDAALLDVNLGGEMVFPVAEALEARDIPFAFATGYADRVSRSAFSGSPTLTKPLEHGRLKLVLDGLLES